MVALELGPMLAEVGPGYQTKSIVFKRGTKGAIVVAVVVSDVFLIFMCHSRIVKKILTNR